MFIERFLNWLNEDLEAREKSASRRQPKTPRQITQRSPPTPQRLSEIATEYQAKQWRAANEQYEAFLQMGYPNFVLWVECLLEKSAAFGGCFLLLTFDNATSIVTASTPGPREILGPTSYALPISPTAVPRVAAATAEHFERSDFRVYSSRQESTCSRLGTQLTPAYDCLDIQWVEAEVFR